MAETVLLLAVKKIGSAVGKEVTTQFTKHAVQLTELQGSMGRSMTELRVIHDFLCQMDIRSRGNQVYQGWLEEVCKVVYMLEDMVDEYLHLVGHQHDLGCYFFLKRSFKQPRYVLSLDRIACMMKETEKNLAHLYQTKERWVLTTNNSDLTSDLSYIIVQKPRDLANISRSLEEEDLVGIEDNKQKLVEWLGDGDLARSVIVVHGMGGLGKTTLVATVYKNEQEKFHCHAWISVSQTYTREDILRQLIIEISNQLHVVLDISAMDMACLQHRLKSFLQEKKYLIVLDDVWTAQVHNDLFGALVPNLEGSRIIITTRNADIVHFTFQERALEMRRLSKDDSWELFCKKAFLKQECPIELKDISEQMVSKCDGLPLAIVSIGSLLFARDKTLEEWKKIHNQLGWELINNPGLVHVRNVLHLSYIYLPTSLKCCFLYCSLFPEDYLFKRKKLIRLWLAEGFIEMRGRNSMEEVAEGYINELVRMNLLQLVKRNSFGRVKSFRMHDVVRELAVDLCRRERFGVVYRDEDNLVESLEVMDERRMIIHTLNKDINQAISNARRLRSLIVLDKKMPSSKRIVPLIADNSRYMSILELSGLPIDNIPDAIGDLFNLRHLGLRDSKVKLLPDSIERLSNLLTLDLFRSKIQELPKGIVKLKKLRHLFATNVHDRSARNFRCHTGVRIHNGLERLTKLQTLQALEVQHEGSMRCLGQLKQMRTIRIWGVKGIYCEGICEYLHEMEFLSYLSINANGEDEVLQLNRLNPLPTNLKRLSLRGRLAQPGMLLGAPATGGQNNHSLYAVRLSWCQLDEDPLPSLSRWSNLTYLSLTRAYIGEQLVFLQGWFPRMKELYLTDMPDLMRLEIHQGALTSLQELVLVNLRGMTEVPPGIEFLQTTLKYLTFGEITEDFLTALHQCSRIGSIRWRYSIGGETVCSPVGNPHLVPVVQPGLRIRD
uniref:NB-ARC domain-containing protein n=1 Tax=Oryza nivara TaxID=4536 RepID=A0A0E0G6P8_ORYNI